MSDLIGRAAARAERRAWVERAERRAQMVAESLARLQLGTGPLELIGRHLARAEAAACGHRVHVETLAELAETAYAAASTDVPRGSVSVGRRRRAAERAVQPVVRRYRWLQHESPDRFTEPLLHRAVKRICVRQSRRAHRARVGRGDENTQQ